MSILKLAYIGIGANLANPRGSVEGVIESFKTSQAAPSTQWSEGSRLYRSAPIESSGPDYVNAVIEVRSGLTPLALLHALQKFENEAGRQRPYVNAPRVLDLDLLWMEGIALNTKELTLPHPRMHLRAFVLAPLAELAPELEVGKYGKVSELLARVQDQRLALL